MKNFKAVYAILLLVMVAATVGIMFLVNPDVETWTWMSYTNMALLIVFEAAFMFSLSFVSSKKGYNVQGIALANQIVSYSVLMFVLVLAYMLILHRWVPYTWYFVTLIVVTVIYFIVIAVVGMGGKAQQATHAESEARNEVKTDYTNLVKLARAELDSALSMSGLPAVNQLPAKDALRNITDNITMIPVNDFSKKPALTGEVTKWCDTAERLASELEKAGDEASKSEVLEAIVSAAKKAQTKILALK